MGPPQAERLVLRLALFDLDDTLVDLTGAFSRWAVAFAAEHDLPADAVDRLWARYRSPSPGLIALRPHVADGLVRLRAAGWRLGVVTNGQPDNQLAKLRRTGPADLVDGWCASGEVGVRKPDPAISRSAARRCPGSAQDGPAEQGWVVGDSPELDVDGGCRAGLRTFWISHDRPWPAGRTPPDRVAADTHPAIRALLEDR